MDSEKNILDRAIKALTGPAIAARCGISVNTVYRWQRVGRLPRTEWTGETCYARTIAEMSDGRFAEADLLSACHPLAESGARYV